MAGEAEPGGGPDRKRYAITEAGTAEVEAWLAEPSAPEPHLQAELFAKVVLALMLGRPAEAYLDVQRGAHLRRMRELTEVRRAGPLVDTLLADYGLYHLEADLHWIDTTTARLGRTGGTGACLMNTPLIWARGREVVRPDASPARSRRAGGGG